VRTVQYPVLYLFATSRAWSRTRAVSREENYGCYQRDDERDQAHDRGDEEQNQDQHSSDQRPGVPHGRATYRVAALWASATKLRER